MQLRDLDDGIQGRQGLTGEYGALRRRQAGRIGVAGQWIHPHRVAEFKPAIVVLGARNQRERERNAGQCLHFEDGVRLPDERAAGGAETGEGR